MANNRKVQQKAMQQTRAAKRLRKLARLAKRKRRRASQVDITTVSSVHGSVLTTPSFNKRAWQRPAEAPKIIQHQTGFNRAAWMAANEQNPSQ